MGVFAHAEAEVLVLRKWDERKLAYPIRGQKRGVYVLAIFKARGTQIANIERDCNLSEQVTRCLIIQAEYMGEVELELAKKEVPLAVEAKLHAEPAKAPALPADAIAVPAEATIDADLDEPASKG